MQPAGITAIGAGAFENCIALQSFTIPDGTCEVGKEAFQGCSSLAVVAFAGACVSVRVVSRLICVYLCASCTHTLTSLFYTYIYTGTGVKTVGYETFKGCTSLVSITLPTGVCVCV